MLRYSDFSPQCKIVETAEMPRLSAALDAEVVRLWELELADPGAALFNGYIFSIDRVTPKQISGRFVRFARYLAQRRKPELYGALSVRPLAVTGFLRCADGLVLGRRHSASLQDPDHWEFVPSGFVDTSARCGKDLISVTGQLLRELEEEAGIDSSSASGVEPYCLVEDRRTHIFDVGIRVDTTLSGEDILDARARCSDDQYAELAIVPEDALSDFIRDQDDRIAAVSRLILERAGLRPA